MNHNYYVYILTNIHKQVLYIGVTNNITRRIYEHDEDAKTKKKTFAGKYNCIYLLYYENYQFVKNAIAREKELKGWTRKKKDELIKTMNPDLKFLNEEVQ